MYGRKTRLPIDLNEGEVSNVEFQPEVKDSLQTQREAIKKKASMKIHAAQSRQKAAYDKRHTSKDPPIGALVYIKNTRRIHRMGSKLEPRWTGPYRMVQLLGKARVRLVHAASKRKLKNTYHMSNLKVFPSDGLSTDQKSSDIDHPASEEVSEEEDCSVLSSGSPLTDAPQPGIFQPIPTRGRKNLSTVFILCESKPVYYGRKSELLEPRRIHKTKEDGNCYFRAISYVLTGSEDSHGLIRQKIVNHMSNDINEKFNDYLNQSVNDYLRESSMNSNGTWATDAEMMATASLLGIDIVVHSKVADRMEWLRYPTSFSNERTRDFAIYLQNISEHINRVISVQ